MIVEVQFIDGMKRFKTKDSVFMVGEIVRLDALYFPLVVIIDAVLSDKVLARPISMRTIAAVEEEGLK